MNFKFTEFIYGSEDYQQCLSLREQVLRKPLGRVLTPQELQKDIDDIHLGLKAQEEVIACLILTPVSDQAAKMRQVAVSPHLQNRGLGKTLVLEAENFARKQGFREIELQARISAQNFYQKLGYQTEGKSYEAVGIPHIKMKKKL